MLLGYLLIPVGSAKGNLPVLFLLMDRFFGFSRHVAVAPIKVKFGREKRTTDLRASNFTLIGSGVWVNGPKTMKISNFTNIIGPKARVPRTILTKFTRFMRVVNLHNYAECGCFSSINGKIINNLPRRWHCQPNFR